MRMLLLCVAGLSLSGRAQEARERPSPAASSIVLVQNGFPGESRTILLADGADSVTIAIEICDASGQPMANLPVRLEVTGSRNIVTPAPASVTDMNGLFIANLTTTAAETKTITVIADPGPAEVLLRDQPSVTFRAGPPTHFEVVHEGATSLVVGRDFFGNLVAAKTH
jgi:hypothetical protein